MVSAPWTNVLGRGYLAHPLPTPSVSPGLSGYPLIVHAIEAEKDGIGA